MHGPWSHTERSGQRSSLNFAATGVWNIKRNLEIEWSRCWKRLQRPFTLNSFPAVQAASRVWTWDRHLASQVGSQRSILSHHLRGKPAHGIVETQALVHSLDNNIKQTDRLGKEEDMKPVSATALKDHELPVTHQTQPLKSIPDATDAMQQKKFLQKERMWMKHPSKHCHKEKGAMRIPQHYTQYRTIKHWTTSCTLNSSYASLSTMQKKPVEWHSHTKQTMILHTHTCGIYSRCDCRNSNWHPPYFVNWCDVTWNFAGQTPKNWTENPAKPWAMTTE